MRNYASVNIVRRFMMTESVSNLHPADLHVNY